MNMLTMIINKKNEKMLDIIGEEIVEQSSVKLKFLKFENNNDSYVFTLHDNSVYSIVRGYGTSIIEAINDMHSCLI